MVHEKVLSIKVDLYTAIWRSWNHFDRKYVFKLDKLTSERTWVSWKFEEEQLSINYIFVLIFQDPFLTIRLFRDLVWEKIISLIQMI